MLPDLEDVVMVFHEPRPPAELWMLWSDEFVDWVVSSDSLHSYLCATCEADAILESEHQATNYDLPCRPIQVK